MKTKSILLLCVIVLTTVVSFAQTQVTPKITEVTVFSNAAEVKSIATVNASSGTTNIVCIDITGNMQVNSLKINPPEGVEITGFSVESYYLLPETLIPNYKQMNDSINMLNNNIGTLRNRFDAFTAEKGLLISNQSIGGDQNGVTLLELKNISDFYRERLLLINNELSKLTDEIVKLEAKMSEISNRMAIASYKNETSRKKVYIDISCESARKADIELRYLVGKCGWAATYDIIAEEINMPVKLKYKANVLNNSGIDWNNVQLVLSTLDPLKGASAPVLTPWYLNYSSNNYYEQDQYRYSRSSNEIAYKSDEMTVSQIMDPNQAYENISVSELSTEFIIERKYSIPSDQKPFKIDITEYDLAAEYKYVTIPKMETKAYLLARITGWEKYELIDGDMNVYYSNSYIGVSRLNTNTVNDTLDLSLGRDNKIMVTRIKMEDFSSKSLLGSNRKESNTYEIQIKNNKSTPVKIEVVDQIPVSQESEIEVGINDISAGEYNAISGIVKWNIELQPSKSQKYTISYWVKYPKNKPVQMNRKRAVSAPRF